MTYGFNGCLNPKVQSQDCRWAGVITNVHYQKFLLRRFPDSRWYWLDPGREEDGGLAVGLIPIHQENQGQFNLWKAVHDYLHFINFEAENILNSPPAYRAATQNLAKGYPLLKADPFLESVFGEWVAQYHFSANNYDENMVAIQRAIQKGYPAANLYYKLGSFYYYLNRQPDKSRQAYLLAARCHPNYTNANEVLATLWGGRK